MSTRADRKKGRHAGGNRPDGMPLPTQQKKEKVRS
jgi:hypothetical protein